MIFSNFKKKNMNIFLVEANHATRGITTNTVPISLAMIARYLSRTVNYSFKFKMAKTICHAREIINSGFIPDVLAISQYHWCTQSGLYIARFVKERIPKCLVVAGGPNISRTSKGRLNYLQTNPWIDLCVELEGEIAFQTIIKRFLSGESIRDLKMKTSSGIFALHPETSDLNYNGEHPPHLPSLDLVGTMYSDGFLDEMLDMGFHPFTQIQRGCPFSCAFCHASAKYYSNIRFQSNEVFQKDMEYLGKRYAGQHSIPLYLGATNFGLYKQDIEHALIIRNMQEKYDWPKQVVCSTVKLPHKIKAVNDILKYKMPEKIALQTLSPQVLANIKRKNIPFKSFLEFQKDALRRTGNSNTELILALPGETKQSFIDGLTQVIDSGVHDIVIYTLMKLEGTDIASDKFVNKYSFTIRHRLVPRDFSDVDGTKIFETDEVVVATNTMSESDYYEIRGYSFTIMSYLFASEFLELRLFLRQMGVTISQWVYNVHEQMCRQPGLAEVYKNFMFETKEELFQSYEALVEYYAQEKNYSNLLTGEKGDNLVRKYRFIVLTSHYSEALELAIIEAKKLLIPILNSSQTEIILDDFQTYLSTRNLYKVFFGNNVGQSEYYLTFDIPCIIKKISNKKLSFDDLEEGGSYKTFFSDYSKKLIKECKEQYRDPELSLQILYRDALSKDCWPKWNKQ